MTVFEQKLKQWALNQYGIILQDHQLPRIHHRIQKWMAAHRVNEERFFEALKLKEKALIQATIDICTVQESYFFRDPSLFAYLKTRILPEILYEKRKNKDLQLNIWSVGCAFGEEIYSLAMQLNDLLPDIKQWKINLIATDINDLAIERAKKGLFTQSSMRIMEDSMVKEYFDYISPYFHLKKHICNMVCFKHENIINLSKSKPVFDLIFCRNVFIYLQREVVERALYFFYDSLVDNGFLFLGTADILGNSNHPFEVITKNKLLFLKKAQRPGNV